MYAKSTRPSAKFASEARDENVPAKRADFLKFLHFIYTEILFIFFQIIHYTKEISIHNSMHEFQL